MFLSLENNMRGCTGSVMGDRYVKSDENKKRRYINATNFYGHSMCQPLPYDEIESENEHCSNKILITPDDSDIGFFSEVDLRYHDNKK